MIMTQIQDLIGLLVMADLHVSEGTNRSDSATITESIITENAKSDHVSTGLKQMESNLGREYRHE